MEAGEVSIEGRNPEQIGGKDKAIELLDEPRPPSVGQGVPCFPPFGCRVSEIRWRVWNKAVAGRMETLAGVSRESRSEPAAPRGVRTRLGVPLFV